MPYVLRETAQSLMALVSGNRIAKACEAHGFSAIAHAWYSNSPRVDVLRNAAVSDAKKAGFTHLLFLDVDMIFPDDLLLRILRHHDAGIVGGLYVQKQAPFRPVALRDGEDRNGVIWYQHDIGPFGTDLRPQQVLGMGCTLIPMSVFEAIGPAPWFAYQNNEDGFPLVSEDVPFCQRAGAAGIPILLDPTIQCGHLRTEAKTELHFARYVKSYEAMQAQGPMAVTIHGHDHA